MSNDIDRKSTVWFQIAGRKNSGKTRLMCELITLFAEKGYQVGTVKHSSHKHDIDVRGKDSWKHRESGAMKAALISRKQAGLFFNLDEKQTVIEQFEDHFASFDLVLVESGGATMHLPTIEIWRKETGQELLEDPQQSRIMIVSADQLPEELELPVLSPNDPDAIVNFIEEHYFHG